MALTIGLSITGMRIASAAPAPGTGFAATVADFSRDRTLFDSGAARGLNAAAIPVSGTTDAPDGTTIEMRILRADTGAEVAPWAAVATAAGGAWAGAYSGAGRSVHWLRPEVRVQGAAETATTATRFGVGHVWAIWQQSEHHRMLDFSFSRTAIAAPLADDDVAFVYHQRDGDTVPDTFTTAPEIRSFNAATRAAGEITAAMAALANVLIAERPGEKFLIVPQTLSGTSFTDVMNDGAVGRQFARDKQIHDLAVADGSTVGLALSTWYNAPRGLADNYGRAFLAFAHGKTYDGADFVDGEGLVNGGDGGYTLTLPGASSLNVDHTCRELYGSGATVWAMAGPHRYEAQSVDLLNAVTQADGDAEVNYTNWGACRAATRALIADHPALFRKGIEALSYENGEPMDPGPGWTDLNHPNSGSDDGLPRLARLTAHALLHGAGLAGHQEPVLNRAHWDADGAFAEFWFEDSAGATPGITTTRIARGEALQTGQSFDVPAETMDHVTDVFGVEINKRPAVRAEIATGTTVASTVIRVYPQPGAARLYGSDTIDFGRGGATGIVRHPEDFRGAHWKNWPLADIPATGIEGLPISAEPAIVNPLTVFPTGSDFDFTGTTPTRVTGLNQSPATPIDLADGWGFVLGANTGGVAWDLSGVIATNDVLWLRATIRLVHGSQGTAPVRNTDVGANTNRDNPVTREIGFALAGNSSLTSAPIFGPLTTIAHPGGVDPTEFVIQTQIVANTGRWIGVRVPNVSNEFARVEIADMQMVRHT